MTPRRSAGTAVRDLTTRQDIVSLLGEFYGRALHDGLLEPVFASAGMDLATHLPRIASFWEVRHFQRWLTLWHQVVTELYVGPTADRAQTDAVRMAAGMLRVPADADRPFLVSTPRNGGTC